MKLLLASKSPRRQELLQALNIHFETVSIDCEEIIPQGLEPEKVAAYLSDLKANSYTNIEDNEVLLTADTIVVCENEILGKPKDKNEAYEMLKKLSDNTHHVYTAFTLKTAKKTITKTDKAEVTLDFISEKEIDYYICEYNPIDKAGSYGVQEWLGMTKITKISGSFYTIMGLPTHLIYKTLKELSFFQP